jgi:hypothetical protein
MSESEFIHIIDSIYEAGLDPDHWPVVMDRVTDYVGAEQAMMGYSDTDSEHADVLSFHRVDEDVFVDRWIGDYGLYDPWSHTGATIEEGDVRTGA